MKIACLSGKGGAGKTLVATNLALASGAGCYIDCDVEEPNGHLFLKPDLAEERTVSSLLPDFDQEKCIGCKKCVEFCRFHALIYIKTKPMVFPEVCHSCGGCALVCPSGAVGEKAKTIGKLQIGHAGKIKTVTGILDPGEASGVPLINAALAEAQGLTVIDCPPGSACSVMESIMDADFCLLVAEPSAFGFHNFKMVHELVQLLGKPCAVVINKQDQPYQPLEDFCREQQLPILARIAYDPQIAAIAARGELVYEKSEKARELFDRLWAEIGGRL